VGAVVLSFIKEKTQWVKGVEYLNPKPLTATYQEIKGLSFDPYLVSKVLKNQRTGQRP
jgi:hypothetical protein